jgi:putative spermidine/putrescine transport system ATP-binding protein
VAGREPVGIQLRDLNRRYGEVRALDGLSLDIAPGELVALLGPSGCGKTTALRVLAGFEAPDSGTVRVGDVDMTDVPASRRDMGMVFQAYSLFPNMTAIDNVAFGPRLRGVDGRTRKARARELLELVGLAGLERRWPHEMSGGQQQRVALARALAIEPRVLLLDEPLSALDAKVRATLRDEIRSLQLRLGITTLFVTHDQDEALSMADRVGVMRGGRLEQIAPPEQVYAWPATPFVAEFVGTVNRIPGRIVADAVVEVLGQRLPVVTVGPSDGVPVGPSDGVPVGPSDGVPAGPAGGGDAGGQAAPRSQPAVGTEVDVLVRPESVLLVAGSAASAAAAPHPDGWPGVVRARTFRGASTRVRVELDGPAAPASPGGVIVQADMGTPDIGTFAIDSPVAVRLADRPVLVTGSSR